MRNSKDEFHLIIGSIFKLLKVLRITQSPFSPLTSIWLIPTTSHFLFILIELRFHGK